MDKLEKPSSSHRTPTSAGHDVVPALEVPLGNVDNHEDELLSWLQYPLEDTFDKNYCSKEISMEAPSLVHDAFSNLTLKEGEKWRSTSLRSHKSLPSGLTLREREDAGDPHMASRTWSVTAAYDTKRGDRVQAANTAMAIGAHRAAGLLFQSGAETFNRVRTNAQWHFLTGSQNLATQETGRSGSAATSHISKAGDEEPRFQHSARRLTSPNFPLFSRAVTSSRQDKLGVGTQGRGRDFALKGEQKASVASPSLHTHLTLPALGTSSGVFGAPIITKDLSVCFPPSSTARMTDINFRSVPFQCENDWQPLTAHMKEAVSTLSTEFTKQSSISQNLGGEAVSMIPVEEASTASRAECASKGSPSFSTSAPAGIPSGSFEGLSVALPHIETKGSYPTFVKGNPYTGAKLTFTTDVESSMHSELACHNSEGSGDIKGCNVAFPLKKARLVAGEELDSSSCPLVMVSGLTTSEPKVWETVERGEITMASPLGDISEKSIKEATASMIKRKAQDIEMESQNLKDRKLTQGSASAAKKSRTAEIHNLSEKEQRNKINVAMKTLQDLIPNANMMDEALVLDEAIEYMKLLQSEVQLMSLRTGVAGVPMVLRPGMSSAPMQQRLPSPPHLNVNTGGGGLGFTMGIDVIGHPISSAPYSTCGLQLASSHAAPGAYGHLRSPREDGTYMPLPAQLQQQYMLSNMHANAGMFETYTIQREQKASQSHSPPEETSTDEMQ